MRRFRIEIWSSLVEGVVHVVIRVGKRVAVSESLSCEVVEGGDRGQHVLDEGEDLHGAVRVGAD